jgi:hypothetical protein
MRSCQYDRHAGTGAAAENCAKAIVGAEIPANGDVNIFRHGSVNYAFCAPGQKVTDMLQTAAQARDKVGKEN